MILKFANKQTTINQNMRPPRNMINLRKNSLCSLKGDFEDRILELNRANFNPDIQPPNPNPIQNPITNNHPPNPFRLPYITIPKFSGDYASWPAFRDMFVSLVHSNAALSDVQKLHYSKSNLRDKAADFLRHTPITAENYVPS